MWNGTVAIGDVVFPVKLYAVMQDRRVRFREVRFSDGCKIVHRRFGSESGEEVPSERIRRAYEFGDGNQVVLEDEEIASARGPVSKVVQIEHFVPADAIDPIYYDRPYLIGAQPGGEHAYRVMLAALAQSGKAGIGHVTLRTREQLVTLAPHGDALRMYTMHYADEIIPSASLDLPALTREPTARELEMAERLVDSLADEWQPALHEDRQREAVMALIRQKAAGEDVTAVAAPEPAPTPDLLAALEASLAAKPKRRTKPATTKSDGKPAPAKPRAATGGRAGTGGRSR